MIHMATDTFGRPVRFLVDAGQSHDVLAARALIEGFSPQAVLADWAYGSNDLHKAIADLGAKAVIPSTRSCKTPIPHDAGIYRCRNPIERCFNKLKHSGVSPRASIGEPSTSSPSSTSQQP